MLDVILESVTIVKGGYKLEAVTTKMVLLAVKILANVHYAAEHGQPEDIF